ncbi:cysteine desulfurase NifS [Thermovirga lienii]|uniref:cysteine desulfurase NifS n=1 Tax=Thermovirga lienii TaxID=336261 RepID=UPI000EC129C7|nr:cysteine desulfurase NifS [Thermovirga lienii]
MKRKVYMDHSATTPLAIEVFEAMEPYLKGSFGNPNSIHAWGREARKAVNEARDQIADLINAESREIIITGGGSEADNLAIKGTAFALQDKGKHIITSAIEHHAVLDACDWLEKIGFEVTVLPVDSNGTVDLEALEKAIRDDTILITIMYANNEVGTIQPVEKIIEIAKKRGVRVHLDGVQAVGHIPVDVKELDVDLLTLSAHKMYGPKGVGALYVKKGTKLVPIIHGGGQEFGLRSGTENTAGIIGFGAAAKLAKRRLEEKEHLKEAALRDKLLSGIMKNIPHAHITGHPTQRLPFHASVCFDFIEGESLLLRLDAEGIGASSGSACTSGSLEPSHVLLAMGISHERAHGSLRLTLGKDTTEEDIDYILEVLPKIVTDLRALSPLGKDITTR